MMHAFGIKNKTTTKTAAPRLQIEDPFDKSFRPEDLPHCVHLIRDDKSCPNEKESSTSEWEIDLAAFNEVELDSLLSAMGDKQHPRMSTEGTVQSVGEQAAVNTQTDQLSMVSEDANDDHSWEMGVSGADDEVDWEVISDADSVISLVSNAAIPWSYKDALTLGKGSDAMDRDETCTESLLPNLQPIVDIQLRSSSSKHQTASTGTDEEFDADFFRDGAKMARGGRTARMFKGNYPPKKKQMKVSASPGV
jgi:hypothetical protein